MASATPAVVARARRASVFLSSFLVIALSSPRPIDARPVRPAVPTTAHLAPAFDLECAFPWWQFEWNVVALGPIGQTFVPIRDRMNWVTLMLAEGPSFSEGVDLAINVRTGTITGAIVATSRAASLPDGVNDLVRFDFDVDVSLAVGTAYTFEIVRVSETGYAMVRGADGDPCAGGSAWSQGQHFDHADLFYRIGWDDLTPSDEVSWSTVKGWYR